MPVHSVVTGNYHEVIKLTPTIFLVMAGIQNSWQHDSWLKMATKGPYHPYFFSSWGRVWVHHLSLNSGHYWNGDCQWQPLLELQLAVTTISNCHSSGGFFPTTHLHTNKQKLGKPMKISSSLWWNSGGELKLYLGCTGSTSTCGGLNEENESWALGQESDNLLTIHNFFLQSLTIHNFFFNLWQSAGQSLTIRKKRFKDFCQLPKTDPPDSRPRAHDWFS